MKERLILVAMIVMFSFAVYALTFSDTTAADFLNGTFVNTSYNGTGVILNSTLAGTFTSRVFDGAAVSRWNNLSWSVSRPTQEHLFAVDGSSDVFRSINYGTNWTERKDDYNGGDGNGAHDMVSNGTGLFVLHSQKVWSSTNYGANWSETNSNYNGADTSNGVAFAIYNEFIVIIEADEDVWLSNNSGVNFTKVALDFNGANGDVFGIVANYSGAFFTADAASDVWQSTNFGTNWTLVKGDYNAGVANGGNDMAINNSGAIYIVDGQDIWYSINYGTNWTLVNDDFNGAGDAQQGIVLHSTLNDSLFIIDAGEDVFVSANGGVNFSLLVSDYNGASAGVLGLTSVNILTNVTLQARNCSNPSCGDGVFSGPSGNMFFTNVTNSLSLIGRYFQYRAYLSSQDLNLTPVVYNVSLDYVILDDVGPNLTIESPANLSYANASILVNISASDFNGLSSVWFYNGTANITYSAPAYYTFSQGSRVMIAYANDSFGNLNSTSVVFSVDSVLPVVNITHPISGSAFGANTSLVLNFTVSEANLMNCWYHIDGENNASITNCGNVTFNVSEGSHTIRVYANDTFGNIGFDENSFSIVLGGPLIALDSPANNSYLNYTNVLFNYTANDIDLNSCQLWGNFNGSFVLNQTNASAVVSGQANNFTVQLGEGTHTWNVGCLDGASNFNFGQSNRTLSVDVTKPSVMIASPAGIFNSLNSIPLNLIVNDFSPANCTYNISYAATGGIVPGFNNLPLLGCSNSSFNLVDETNYILRMLAIDSAGNANVTYVNFSVDVPDSGSSSSSSGGSGGGGGPSGAVGFARIDFSNISAVKVKQGESQIIEINVRNGGARFLNRCSLSASGESGSWISSSEIYSIASGQTVKYNAVVSVPRATNIGFYTPDIIITCNETMGRTPMSIEVLQSDFELIFLNYERADVDTLEILYTLEDFSGVAQNINVAYVLINSAGVNISEGKEDVSLNAFEKREILSSLALPKDAFGEIGIEFKASNGNDETIIMENVILPRRGITGFAISQENLRTLRDFGVLILIVVGLFMGARFIYSHHKRNALNVVDVERKMKRFIHLKWKE